jgi:outer membrane receptor protein involved in Fe transport
MKAVLFSIFSMCTLGIHAQHSLSGTVKDQANGEAIAYATVALMSAADSSIATGVTTDTAGVFRLSGIRDGEWLVRISFVGYETAYRRVSVPQQRDLGEILLAESANRLSEVVVTATRPFVEQRGDRYIVNVGSHIQTGGRTSLEVLGNTPGVLVTPDGDVSVMGNSVNIYINGRPSNLSGEQLKTLLSSIQGETIDRIEVITNPSSRYDASGGSIIDIKLKRGLEYGLNGSIDAGFRLSRKDRENGGLNLNYRTGALNIYGNLNMDRSSSWSKIHQVNNVTIRGGSHSFEQKAENQSIHANYGEQYKTGMDYFVNAKHTIGAFFSGYHAGDAGNRITGRTDITPSLDGIGHSMSDSRKTNGNDGKQLNLNYQGNFSKPGQQLNIDIDYGQFNATPFQYIKNEYYDTENIQIDEAEQLRHTNRQKIELQSAKADYTQPLWKDAKIEFGGKASQSRTDNNLIYEDYTGLAWETDRNQSNHFIYTEQIHAAYVNVKQTLGKWNFQAGLRGEYTNSKGDQKTTGEINDSTYLNLFPSFYVDYRLSESHQFNFSYARRIMRPAYGQLNPFEFTIDAYSFSAGNPYLKPLIMDNFSLSYTNRTGLMARLAYNLINNTFIETPIQDGERYGIKYNNFGKRSTLTFMANYRKSITKFWMMNIMIEGAYAQNSSDEAYGSVNNNGFAGDAQLYNSFTVTPTLSAELSAMYSTSQKFAYYHAEPMSNVSAGIRKMFLNNKLSVSLSANDLFHSFKTDMRAKNEGMDYRIKVERDSRWVNASVRYIFGSDKVKASRRRSSGIEDEAGRAR